jgi:hypothetical protein
MSPVSKPRKPKAKREPRVDVCARIARATGERKADVQAALAALAADGMPEDELWEMLGAIPADGSVKVVDVVARKLTEREALGEARPSLSSMGAAEQWVRGLEEAVGLKKRKK